MSKQQGARDLGEETHLVMTSGGGCVVTLDANGSAPNGRDRGMRWASKATGCLDSKFRLRHGPHGLILSRRQLEWQTKSEEMSVVAACDTNKPPCDYRVLAYSSTTIANGSLTCLHSSLSNKSPSSRVNFDTCTNGAALNQLNCAQQKVKNDLAAATTTVKSNPILSAAPSQQRI